MQLFFLFIVFNGLIVFKEGALRWFGVVVCAVVIACWIISLRLSPARPVRQS